MMKAVKSYDEIGLYLEHSKLTVMWVNWGDGCHKGCIPLDLNPLGGFVRQWGPSLIKWKARQSQPEN